VDKGLKRFMKGRPRIAVVMMVCLVALVALPAMAHAEAWSSEYPNGKTLRNQPAVIAVDVSGAALNASTGQIKVGNTTYTAAVIQTMGLGSWTWSEAADVNGVYHAHWAWATGTGSVAKSTLICDKVASLTAGDYTVTASVKDTSGNLLTDGTSWSFTIAANTVIVPITPQTFDNLTCTTGSSCHTHDAAGYATDVAMGSNCYSCHSITGAVGAPQHGLTPEKSHIDAAAKCETSGCHTGTLESLHPTCLTCHPSSGATKTCATVGCHDTRIDADGNVVSHWFTAAGHTASSSSLAGDRYMSDAAAMAGNGTLLNPTFHWTSTCMDCHSMALDAQHADPTAADSCVKCHKTDNTGAGDVLKGGKWNQSCLASGCHTADPNGGVPVSHLVNGQMDYSHSVATSLTTLPGGCSAPAGSGSYSGLDYQRTACHYSDIIQEHNRKIENGPGGTVVQTIAVSCAQCHASAQFKALNGTWDGTCDACHDGTVLKNHSIVGSAEYTRVHGLHQAPAYYSTGTTSTQGALISGINTMDAHGPLRTASVAAHPAAYKPIGCAQAFCHQNAYMKPGSGFYTAASCIQCHAASVAPANAPTGLMSANNGAVFSASTAVTVDSNIVANGGATLVSMAVDPGTGVYGTAVPYVSSYGITIPSSAGMKTIRVKYTDSAALTSTYTTWIWKVNGPSTITASVSGGNGTISPSGAVSVAQAANQTFTFTPSAGYHVDTLVVDSTPVATPGSSYSFTNVTAGHTIVVTFAQATEAYSGVGPDLNGDAGWQTGLTLTLGSALPANSALDFKTKFDIENGWDYGYVQVSTNGGTSWTNIPGTFTTTADPNGGAGGGLGNAGNGITGTQSTLASAHFDLSAYAGQAVKIRFYYVCDWNTYGNSGTPATSGWHIDDVAVGPTGSPIFTDDFSTMKPDWATYTNTPGYVWGY